MMKTIKNLELGYKNCLIIFNGAIPLVCPFSTTDKPDGAGNNPGFLWDHVFLTFWNDMVAKFNKSFLMKLPGEVHTYHFIDSVD